MSAVSEEQVGAVGRLLINPARPLKERFRALFTLKNIGGPLALDWIIKVGISIADWVMFIPDSNFFHPGSKFFFHTGSRIRIKEFKYFNPKNYLSSPKYDPGCSSRNRIPDPDFFDVLPIPDPGGQKGTGSRIPDKDPQDR
jgi:hypothetical protein